MDVAQFRSLTPDEKYANVFTRGTFTLFDTTELYTELSYSKKKSEFSNLPSAVSGAWGYPGGAVNASSGDGATVLAPAIRTTRTTYLRACVMQRLTLALV